MGWVVGNQLIDVTNQLPQYRADIRKKIALLHSPRSQELNKAADIVKEIGSDIAAAPASSQTDLNKMPGAAKSSAKSVPVEVFQPASNPLESLNSVIGPVGSVVIVIVLSIFMLMGREDLRNRFIRLVAHGRFSAMTQALDDAGSRVSRYLLLQFIVNSGFGLVIGLGFYFIGIPNALLWGVAAAVLRFLPYIGAPLSAVVPILLSLVLFTGWTRPLMTIGLYVVVELIVANFLEPLLYGGQTGISSFAILFAAIFWTLLWGPIGLVLSTPFTVCLVVLGRHVPRLEFVNILLGDEPVLPPGAHYYQRLLANDQEEAKEVLQDYLKEHSLSELYDSVLIPGLSLAEQDSYTNDLDEGAATFT